MLYAQAWLISLLERLNFIGDFGKKYWDLLILVKFVNTYGKLTALMTFKFWQFRATVQIANAPKYIN